MHLLGIVAIIYVIYQLIKEAFTPTLTAEHWANKELQNRDRINGMTSKEILKNAEKGRYYIPKEVLQAYPVVHRDSKSGKKIIENSELYNTDVKQYGAYQAQKWIDQGKYNLNPDELEIARLKHEREMKHLYSIDSSNPQHKNKVEEIDKILAIKKYDFRNTEAVRQWRKARDAEGKYYK